MVTALLVLCGVGLTMASLLAVGTKVFAVKVDEKYEKLLEIMPGANCGGCGYPGCSGYAKALAEGNAAPTSCPPGGADLAEEIGKILGIEVEKTEPMTALVACAGGSDSSPFKSEYQGIEDCRAAHLVAGGSKACLHGCLGQGSCIAACKFDAMEKTANGLVRVIPENCTGCGACVDTCPRTIIQMVPKRVTTHVLCNNPEKAKAVKSVCTVGCTGCKLCTKQSKAIAMDGALAKIDYTSDNEMAHEASLACPQNSIYDGREYDLKSWLEDPTVRTSHQEKAAAWKDEQKKIKAAKKAKAKAAKEAKADTKADKGGDA